MTRLKIRKANFLALLALGAGIGLAALAVQSQPQADDPSLNEPAAGNRNATRAEQTKERLTLQGHSDAVRGVACPRFHAPETAEKVTAEGVVLGRDARGSIWRSCPLLRVLW